MSKTKSFPISQTTVVEAYKRVKARKGAGGVDQVDFEEFDKDLKIICTRFGIDCQQVPTSLHP